MKTFFTVKFALLPIAIFVFLILRGMPAAAIGAGFIVALIVCAWRLYARDIKMLEIAALVIFGALAAGMFLAREIVVANAVPLAFVGLGRVFDCDGLVRKALDGRVFPRRVSGSRREPGVRAGQHDPLARSGECSFCCWRSLTP